jgi:hypothetical protein
MHNPGIRKETQMHIPEKFNDLTGGLVRQIKM